MILKSSILFGSKRLRHGFFTRQQGVSEGVYASLNCGLGSGDSPENVRANRARALETLGLPEHTLSTAYQVHSATVTVVNEPWDEIDRPRLDAMVTDRPGVALGILTADCAPVLFADIDKGIIGAAHAGWRGATGGVLEATIEKMELLGARRNAISAAIGPCIHQNSYEVGAEFYNALVTDDPTNRSFFKPAHRTTHHMFDLPGYIGRRLDRLDIAGYETLLYDTCADSKRFFSYRRTTLNGGDDYGRLLSVIALEDC